MIKVQLRFKINNPIVLRTKAKTIQVLFKVIWPLQHYKRRPIHIVILFKDKKLKLKHKLKNKDQEVRKEL